MKRLQQGTFNHISHSSLKVKPLTVYDIDKPTLRMQGPQDFLPKSVPWSKQEMKKGAGHCISGQAVAEKVTYRGPALCVFPSPLGSALSGWILQKCCIEKKKKKCCIEKNFRRCWFWVQGKSTHAITMTCASLVTPWSRIHLPKHETWV